MSRIGAKQLTALQESSSMINHYPSVVELAQQQLHIEPVCGSHNTSERTSRSSSKRKKPTPEGNHQLGFMRRSPRFSQPVQPAAFVIDEGEKIHEEAIERLAAYSPYDGTSDLSEKTIYSIDSKQSELDGLALRPRDTLEIIVQEKSFLFKIEQGTEAQSNLTNHDLRTLKENRCLNDGVINSYIKLLSLNKRSNMDLILTNTYFISNFKSNESEKSSKRIRRLFQKYGMTPNSKVLLPVYWKNKHWMFVVVCSESIQVCDSIENRGLLPRPITIFCNSLFGTSAIPKRIEKFPQQDNSTDCGVFTLCGIRALTLGVPLQEIFEHSIPEIRKNIANELCEWKINEW